MSKPENQNIGVSRKNTVGGQAVIEGVMMKNREKYSVAVRKEDGSIKVTEGTFVSARNKNKFFNLPIIRGVINFVEMLMLSYKTLAVSADALGIDEMADESKFEKWLREKFGKGILDLVMVISTVLGFALAFGLFFFFPAWIGKLLVGTENNTLLTIIESAIKIAIFILYIWAVSFLKDIRRTFEYHGAEHKSIFCFESGAELTAENAKKFKRFHPRCGTSFIFVVLIISMLVLMLVSSIPFVRALFEISILLRVLVKLILLPVVVGVSYEFIMWAGKHDENPLSKILSAPGLWMQRLTTREPDDSQLEVAITALKYAMPEIFADDIAKTEAERAEKSEVSESKTENEQ